MRKILLTSSAVMGAVVCADAARAQVEVSIGGFYEINFGGGANDDVVLDSDDGDNFGFRTDGEIHIDIRGMTDNGLQFGVDIEIETSDQDEEDTLDEAIAFLAGDWGRVVVGFDDGPNETLAVTSPGEVTPIELNDGTQTSFILSPGGTVGTHIDYAAGSALFTTKLQPNGSSDDLKVIYYSPRFSGVQFGISFEPQATDDGTDDNDQLIDAARNLDYHYGVQAAVNYDQTFDGIGVEASAGFAYARSPNDSALAPAIRDRVDDYIGYNLGLRLSYAGFSVGGSFAQVVDGDILNAGAGPFRFNGATNADSVGFDLGVAYATGPVDVGVTVFYGETTDVAAGADAEQLSVLGGVNYAVASGLDAFAGLGYTDFANDDPGQLDNDGVWGFTGFMVSW